MATKKKAEKVVPEKKVEVSKDTAALDYLIDRLQWRSMAGDLVKEAIAMRK
jgi:hypothetical protein